MATDVVPEEQEEATPAALEVQSRIVGMIDVVSSEVYDHPHQWRHHPKSQIKALRQALEHVGQANVIIVYKCVNDLVDAKGQAIPAGSLVAIDGHNRKNASGVATWKAILLDVNDEEAAFLLATLDPISAMAVTEKDKYAALYDSLPVSAPAVQLMLDETLGARLPAANLKFKGGDVEEDDEDEQAAAQVAAIPVSTVRMVQLYCNQENHPVLMAQLDALGEYFQTASITDTVLAVVAWAAENMGTFAPTLIPTPVPTQTPQSGELRGALGDLARINILATTCNDCGWSAEAASFQGATCPECGSAALVQEVI